MSLFYLFIFSIYADDNPLHDIDQLYHPQTLFWYQTFFVQFSTLMHAVLLIFINMTETCCVPWQGGGGGG